MAVDLGSIIRTLEAIEARHPDTRDDLTPIVAALTAADGVLLDVEEARRITSLPSAATVREWIRLGLLAAQPGDAPGRWHVPLVEALRVRARRAAFGALEGDELSAEELALLSATRPGSLPWRRPGLASRSARPAARSAARTAQALSLP